MSNCLFCLRTIFERAWNASYQNRFQNCSNIFSRPNWRMKSNAISSQKVLHLKERIIRQHTWRCRRRWKAGRHFVVSLLSVRGGGGSRLCRCRHRRRRSRPERREVVWETLMEVVTRKGVQVTTAVQGQVHPSTQTITAKTEKPYILVS